MTFMLIKAMLRRALLALALLLPVTGAQAGGPIQPPGPLAQPACSGGNSVLGYTAYGTALVCGTALASSAIANGVTQHGRSTREMAEFELSLKLLMIAAWFSAVVWIMPLLFILTKMKNGRLAQSDHRNPRHRRHDRILIATGSVDEQRATDRCRAVQKSV